MSIEEISSGTDNGIYSDENTIEEEVVRKYIGGGSELSLSKEYGVTRGAIGRILRKYGIPRRGFGQNAFVAKLKSDKRAEQLLDLGEEISRKYKNGASLNKLSSEYKASKYSVKSVLTRYGVTLRSNMEARVVSQSNEWARGNQARAAHFATAGTGEEEIYKLFLDKGFIPIRQAVLGPYNIDLLLPTVAVEVHGQACSPICNSRAGIKNRIVDILNWGWNVFFVWLSPDRSISPLIVEDLVSFAERTYSGPTGTGSYRVIRSSGEFVAEGSCNLNELT